MASNQAAWLMDRKAHPFTVDTAPMPTPGERELLIRVHAVAINPADHMIQTMGIIQETFPGIIGCDLAGEVVEVGTGVTGFKPGDRVIAGVESGAFQLYSVADVAMATKLPDKISYTQGAVLPACVSTAAVAVFHPDNMALDLPRLEPKRNGSIVLVWGGASSVGSCAIQMLRAAGYEVAVTASAHNEQYCKDLGASHVFDYKKDDVVNTIMQTLKIHGKPFAGVFSAVISQKVLGHCIQIADTLGQDEKSKVIGTVLPPGNFPWIPKADALPHGVRLGFCRGSVDVLPQSRLRGQFGWGEWKPSEVGPEVWGKWLTPALESALMRCKPDPEVVGKGLEFVQEACDLIGKGVSAKKLVVELP